jgi:hypothetical protein
MTSVSIIPARFTDITDMPEVHADERRTIYEKITKTKNGMIRLTRIVVTAPLTHLGNHYHDFEERFSGRGEGGTLYTAPKNNPGEITTQALPAGGWEIVVPAGVIHAFQLQKDTVIISEAHKEFIDGVNTHRVVIVPSL